MDVVSEAEWAQALEDIRAEEKRATRAADALAAKRRRLPAVAIDKPYRFRDRTARWGCATCSRAAGN